MIRVSKLVPNRKLSTSPLNPAPLDSTHLQHFLCTDEEILAFFASLGGVKFLHFVDQGLLYVLAACVPLLYRFGLVLLKHMKRKCLRAGGLQSPVRRVYRDPLAFQGES